MGYHLYALPAYITGNHGIGDQVGPDSYGGSRKMSLHRNLILVNHSVTNVSEV
jgi:hypothetical protein